MSDSEKTSEEGKWIGYGTIKVQKGANGAFTAHIPSKIRNKFKLNKGQKLYVEANDKTNQIRYTPMEEF